MERMIPRSSTELKQLGRAVSVPLAAIAVYYLLAFAFANLIHYTIGDNNVLLTMLVDITGAVIGILVLRKQKFVKSENAAATPGKLGYVMTMSAVCAFVSNVLVEYLMRYVFYDQLMAKYSENMSQNQTSTSPVIVILSYTTTIIAAPIMEEILFRGFIFRPMYEYNKIFGYIFSALMFALIHNTLMHLIVAMPMGLAFAFVYAKTGKIRYNIIMHAVFNGMTAILGLASAFRLWMMNPMFVMLCAVIYITLLVILFIFGSDANKKKEE